MREVSKSTHLTRINFILCNVCKKVEKFSGDFAGENFYQHAD